MRAYQITGSTSPAVVDVERPVPLADEVLIKVGAAGVCHTDVELPAVAEFLGAQLPLTAGHEIAGWIDELGVSVTGLHVGEAVAVYGMIGCGRCRECRGGNDQACTVQTEVLGVTRDGGLAEYVCAPARNVYGINDVDVVQASVLTDAGLTAYAAVGHAVGLLRPGSTALVIGVGGLGHLAIQYIRALSAARIIAVDVDDQRLDLARRLGADEVVPAGESAADLVGQLVGVPGIDAVFDFVANDATIELGSASVRMGGAIVLTGVGHGSFTLTTGFDSPVPPEVRVVRTQSGSRSDMHDILQLARTGHVVATATTYPLEETPAVLERLAAGSVLGRAVIVP